MTRRKALQLLGIEDQKELAVTFISVLNQGKVEKIIDPEIVEEVDAEKLTKIGELAGSC